MLKNKRSTLNQLILLFCLYFSIETYHPRFSFFGRREESRCVRQGGIEVTMYVSSRDLKVLLDRNLFLLRKGYKIMQILKNLLEFPRLGFGGQHLLIPSPTGSVTELHYR